MMDIRNKKIAHLTLKIAIPISLTIACIIYFFLIVEREAELENVKMRENHLINLQSSDIDNNIDFVISELSIMSHEKLLKNLWENSNIDVQNNFSSITEHYIEISRHRQLYDQIRLLDANGNEQIRVNYKFKQPEIVPKEKLGSVKITGSLFKTSKGI
jgi:hypothetical protein